MSEPDLKVPMAIMDCLDVMSPLHMVPVGILAAIDKGVTDEEIMTVVAATLVKAKE